MDVQLMWNNSSSLQIKVLLCKTVPRWTMPLQDAGLSPISTRLQSLRNLLPMPLRPPFRRGGQRHAVQRGIPPLGQQGGPREDLPAVQLGEQIFISCRLIIMLVYI